ncbi:MAG TPA: hypothetical protein VGD87_11555 [Archangium sp.]
MPTGFIDQQPARVRKDPLGPTTLNQAHANVEHIDGLSLREHFADGQHNALEVPWVLGHVSSGTTGSLFDTAFGGGTIARPATGEATVSVVSGVLGEVGDVDGNDVPATSILANVSDSDIANTPHTITVEAVSTTSIKTRVRRLTSTLGAPGNSWESVARAFDIAIHGQKQPNEQSELASYTLKQRRDFLTEATTDWNTLVANQGLVRRNLMLEHASDGSHNVDRIAKAAGWFRPTSGPSFGITFAEGVDSVSRISEGVINVRLSSVTLSSTSLAACFAQAQPNNNNELVIINGRCHSTIDFRFYVYVYSSSESLWQRADRAFFAAMFGRPA